MKDVASPDLRRREVDLLKEGRALEAKAYSENTQRAYNSAWRSFETWCDGMRRKALPAEAATVYSYLVEMSRRYKSSTIEIHIAAILKCHHMAGHALDLSSCLDLRRGIRRHVGTRKRSKEAITSANLVDILSRMTDSPVDLRDRAILLLGFAGGLRRSEIASLDIGNVQLVHEGIALTLPRSKGDQEGEGVVVAIPHARRKVLCAVRAVNAWLEKSGLVEGALFRGIDRYGRISDDRLWPASIYEIVVARCASAGIDGVGAHSLRAGAATSALGNGAPIDLVAKHLRHKSMETTRIYDRRANQFKNHPMAAVLDADADDPEAATQAIPAKVARAGKGTSVADVDLQEAMRNVGKVAAKALAAAERAKTGSKGEAQS
jgi:integrase